MSGGPESPALAGGGLFDLLKMVADSDNVIVGRDYRFVDQPASALEAVDHEQGVLRLLAESGRVGLRNQLLNRLNRQLADDGHGEPSEQGHPNGDLDPPRLDRG